LVVGWKDVEDVVDGTATVVVIPSKAYAQTKVPVDPAVAGMTVSPPVESKEVISSSPLTPIDEVQTAPAPGRMESSQLGASKLYPLIYISVNGRWMREVLYLPWTANNVC
jgi:hypothetical protein